MKKVFATTFLMGMSIASLPAHASAVNDTLQGLGLGGLLNGAASGLPSAGNSPLGSLGSVGAPLGSAGTLVGVTSFEGANHGNGDILGASVGSGANTGNGQSLLGAGVLAGQNSGNGGLVGVGVLSEGQNGAGDVLSVRLLNADEAIALGLLGSDLNLADNPSGQPVLDPLSGGSANATLRGLLGKEGPIVGPIEAGLRSLTVNGVEVPVLGVIPALPGLEEGGPIAIALAGANNTGNSAADGLAGVGVLTDGATGNGGDIGAAVIGGDNSGNGLVGGVAVLTGDNSGNGGTAGVGVLTGDRAGNGGVAGVGVLTGDDSATGADVANVGVLTGDNSANGGIVAVGVLTGDNAANDGIVNVGVLTGENSANNGDVNVGVLTEDTSDDSGGIDVGVLNPDPFTPNPPPRPVPPVIDPQNPNDHQSSESARGEGCVLSNEEGVLIGEETALSPELRSQFASDHINEREFECDPTVDQLAAAE